MLASRCSSRPRCRRRSAFGLDDVAARAQQPGGAPVQGAGDRHADAAARARLRRLPRHPLPPREGALARREAAVRADVLPPGTRRSRSRCGSTSSSRRASAWCRSTRRLFDYGKNKLDPQTLSHLGFNGLRVHFAVNKPGYKDEVLVFQGASYFRALGKGQSYGLSARGLAVDTAAAEGEEFPRFVEFWIERPQPERDLADDLRVARLAPHHRRLPLRPDPRRRDRDAGDGPALCAREDRQARHRAADQHVHVRREPARARRLSPRGARLRRPVGPARQRRMDLAPAGQSAPAAGDVVRHHQPARLRPDAARPLAGELRRSRGAVRAAAERVDRAGRCLGRRQGRIGADPDARRDQRQYRCFLGAAGLCDARQAVRYRLPDPLAKRRHDACRRRLDRADATRPRLRQASRRRHQLRGRFRRAGAARAGADPTRSNRSSGSTPMPRCGSATCSRTPSPAPGA